MSGEFGIGNRFFHDLLQEAADCDPTTEPGKMVVEVVRALALIARDVSLCEACDTGPDTLIIDLIKWINDFQLASDNLTSYVSAQEDLIRLAVRDKAITRRFK